MERRDGRSRDRWRCMDGKLGLGWQPKLDLVESKSPRRFSGDEWWTMVRVGVAIRWGVAPPSDVTYEDGCPKVAGLGARQASR